VPTINQTHRRSVARHRASHQSCRPLLLAGAAAAAAAAYSKHQHRAQQLHSGTSAAATTADRMCCMPVCCNMSSSACSGVYLLYPASCDMQRVRRAGTRVREQRVQTLFCCMRARTTQKNAYSVFNCTFAQKVRGCTAWPVAVVPFTRALTCVHVFVCTLLRYST
jgi:hypothetical protein